MDLIARLDAVRARRNVLDHPFYARWSAGELRREELAFYAGEYRHAVVALADAVDAAARAGEPAVRATLGEHAAEEAAHVELWDRFAAEAGAGAPRPPLPETAECVSAWTGSDDVLEGLVTMYAIEASQPAISRTKLEGLVEHYGFAPGGPGTEYFVLHSERDEEHADEARRLLEALAGEGEERLVTRAEEALAGNWTLLDGVERRFG